MRPKVKWQGREALYRRLNQLLPNVEKEVAVEQLEGAKELANRIRPRAPRDTGHYAHTIQADRAIGGLAAKSKRLQPAKL
ncbi:HK97 gp10 family phage protein [Mesorhizobium sp. B3-1-9]|uniref:HK97 gp10 family phage protein n=1 Tax=Mesorhizobium sp. B3-1-9 TaxID=2589892 RepID=UPI0015E35336|nr:HK97 gp10 family phage protein [Mesorhizobium sp. B3-1-9]